MAGNLWAHKTSSAQHLCQQPMREAVREQLHKAAEHMVKQGYMGGSPMGAPQMPGMPPQGMPQLGMPLSEFASRYNALGI